MVIESDQPGIQLYTGNFLDGSNTGKGGAVYGHWIKGLAYQAGKGVERDLAVARKSFSEAAKAHSGMLFEVSAQLFHFGFFHALEHH